MMGPNNKIATGVDSKAVDRSFISKPASLLPLSLLLIVAVAVLVDIYWYCDWALPLPLFSIPYSMTLLRFKTLNRTKNLNLTTDWREPILSLENSVTATSKNTASESAQAVVSIPPEYEPRCSSKHEDFNDYEAPEPFEYLHDCCDDCNLPVDESPDPLVSVTWNAKKLDSLDKSGTKKRFYEKNENEDFVGIPLQIYRTRIPVNQWTIPSEGCLMAENDDPENLGELEQDTTDQQELPSKVATLQRMKIISNCTIVMDWGSERAAWFEVLSHEDLTKDNPSVKVTASISEYNSPYPGKTRELTKYGNHTYRLETNEELYEGVRFTFLHVEFFAGPEDHSGIGRELAIDIDDFSIVSKIKPIGYTGSFKSSNPVLTKAYYWGAYGARLNVEQSQINSILIERGDRVAIQGDGHPTIAALLEVFYGDETKQLLRNVLNATDNAHKRVVDDSIMAYPLYWCLSAMDYYWATHTGNEEDNLVRFLVNDISLLLEKRIDDFLDPNLDITWFGWDDRVGNGWCFHANNDACTREGLLSFAGLVVRVCNDFVHFLLSLDPKDAQISTMIQRYQKESKRMTDALRRVPEYPSGFGVHSAANAINARVATPEEIQQHWMGTTENANTLNNAVTVCSFSQFNQYWILQAFGNTRGGMEHALKSIELCWGPMMELSTGGCFWELSSPEWTRFMKEGDQAPHLPSYCHPWASGVTPWLSRVLGGLVALKPGYKEFVAMPYVSESHPNVTATTDTPHGPISVAARLTPQGVLPGAARSAEAPPQTLFEASIRSGVLGVLGIRKSLSQGAGADPVVLREDSILVHGRPLAAGALLDAYQAARILGHVAGQKVEDHVFVRLERQASERKNGPFVVTAAYGHPYEPQHQNLRSASGSFAETTDTRRGPGSVPSTGSYAPFPPPEYPASVATPLDRTSKGDGLLVYGRDGYVLLGCNATSLPPYAKTPPRVVRHGFPGWVVPDQSLIGRSDTDPLYLPLPGGGRVLGTLGLDDAGGGDIDCVLLDVEVSPGETTEPRAPGNRIYSLSLYFVAARRENRHAIRVMDLETLDVVAPTTLVEDYCGGVWWTLRYDRSVRIKMMDIEGIHLSAIAFASDGVGVGGPSPPSSSSSSSSRRGGVGSEQSALV